MIGFKIIHEVDGQRTEVYTSVAQTQSLFDCLVDKIGDPESWTKLRSHENGVHALGWRKEGRSGCWYPVRGFKDALEQYFQQHQVPQQPQLPRFQAATSQLLGQHLLMADQQSQVMM